jgi:hypothetical protein
LENLIISNSKLLLRSEIKRGFKCIDYLSNGAPAFQSSPLGPCIIKNSQNAIIHGESVTDTIASWVSKKFVAGPFRCLPLANFRANSILAVPQTNKTRVCINVSQPSGKSFNDNINNFELEKIKMSSARNFGYSIIEAGPNCVMAKPDIVDAYKNVPAKISDLRYQGFSWLGRYFVELRQMFGAKGAVQNFDVLSNTVKTIALAKSKISSSLVHRQLDDVPIVGPSANNWCSEFLENYKNICKEINLQLAPEDKNCDKAFSCTSKGKVLGIYFNTRDQTWSLPEDKIEKTKEAINTIRNLSTASTLQIQSLAGRLNFISSMCPFLNSFKFNLNKAVAQAILHGSTRISAALLNDLRIWNNFIHHSESWIPIPHEKHDPPIACLNF